MRTPSLLATLFGFPRDPRTSQKKVVRLHPHGDNIRYEVTITRWSELLNGSARIGAGNDVLLDFEDVDSRSESEEEDEGAGDWDGDEFDDDAEDLTVEEGQGEKEAEEEEEEVGEEESGRARELWETWAAADGRRRERQADVWRTRLGGEGDR